MKKIFLLICLMFVMAFLVVVFSACGGNDEGTDEYGYARPDNCWLTETFVGKANRGYFTSQKDLFTFLELKEIQTNYFGDGGKSGLLHKDTLKAIEEVEEEGYDVGSYNIYCIFYGTCTSEELKNIHTYFSISLVTEDGIYYGKDRTVFTKGNARAVTGNLYVTTNQAEFDIFEAEPDQRIKFRYDSEYTPKELPQEEMTTVFGVFAVTVTVWQPGTLNVTFEVDIDAERETRVSYPTTSIKIGKDNLDEVEPLANIENASVGYLSQSDYNNGAYSEESIRTEAVFENGGYCYMVWDFSITALMDNDGTHSIKALVHSLDRGRLDATIEEAPTIKLETTTLNNETTIYAVYSIPPNAGETKTVRMLVRMLSVSEGNTSVGALILGNDGVEISGEVFWYDEFQVGVPALQFTLSEDGTYYIVSAVVDETLKEMTIPDMLSDGLPVVALGEEWSYVRYYDGQHYHSYSNSVLEQLYLSKSITTIPSNAFEGFKILKTIIYEGTVEQWNSIEKHAEWADGFKGTIVCSDGTITL